MSVYKTARWDANGRWFFVFDEVDYISPGSPTEPRWRKDFNVFWRNLRSVLQECSRQGHPVSILVSGVSSHWFSSESIQGVENAAVALVPEEYLSPMAEGATVAMLRRLGVVAGLRFDEAALRVVAHATGNMPYWARKCCSYIHREIPVTERPSTMTAERVGPLVDTFVANEGIAIAEVALKHLFRVHPQLKDAAVLCRDGCATEVAEGLKAALRRYGILGFGGEIVGAMMEGAMGAWASGGEAAGPEVEEEESESAGTLGSNGGLEEWAEEIATLGRRRNVLEKRLRALVLGFVRADHLHGTAKRGNIKSRVLSGISTERRAKLQHLTVEDAMDKFTWKELTGTIEKKEWSLFEQIFGDKRKFREATELINDRFDAHAKDADLADIALYRRELRYLEERLGKVE